MSLEQPVNYEERRDSIRAQRIVTVRHRLVKHNGRKVSSPWQVSLTENMSLSGLLFVSAIPYEKEDWIEVDVVMSGILDIFKGYGQVIRSTLHNAGYYYVAIKYVDLKSRTKTRSAKKIISKTFPHR
ncbi:MAG: hypothetical protein HQL15_01755 [Candidatus Omnitrophica bacterium]|nr:hypothetical protein [Candidatus Omnitrophota bacterium]